MPDTHLIATGVQTLLFLAGVYAMILKTNWAGKGVKAEVEEMKLELRELKNIVIIQAVQARDTEHTKGEVLMLQRTVEDLRRGKGWVQGHRGVDGEYDR